MIELMLNEYEDENVKIKIELKKDNLSLNDLNESIDSFKEVITTILKRNNS